MAGDFTALVNKADESFQSIPKGDVTGGGSLSDVRVLELGSTVAAPFCGRLLADFGAEVVKVEPLEGDAVRTMGRRHKGRSLYATSIFRNKRLLALDLNKQDGQEIVRKLAAQSDIVIENFRPGRLEQWGLGYEALSAINPGIILVRISGYGQSGPYRDRPGYGATCEAISGLRDLTGDPDRPPARVAVSLTDEVAAIYAAFGAMIALHERVRSGKGQIIDTALYEAAFSLTEPHVPAFGLLGVVAARAGSRLPDSAPNNLYPACDGGYVQITAISQPTFSRLAALIGRPELMADPRFSDAIQRAKNDEALDIIISAWTRTLPLKELENRLIAAEIPAARIYKTSDVFDDPHFRAREMLMELHDPDLGTVTIPGIVPKLSRTSGAVRTLGGAVGADTAYVLREMLHYSEDRIVDLTKKGIVQSSN